MKATEKRRARRGRGPNSPTCFNQELKQNVRARRTERLANADLARALGWNAEAEPVSQLDALARRCSRRSRQRMVAE